MSVYVDKLMPCIPSPKWPFRFACHLIADSIRELDGFARRLGLKREWFQQGKLLPHYDLCASKRKLALELGAIELSLHEIGRRIQEAREQSDISSGN